MRRCSRVCQDSTEITCFEENKSFHLKTEKKPATIVNCQKPCSVIGPAPKYMFINFVQVWGWGGGMLVINGANFVFLWTDLTIVK